MHKIQLGEDVDRVQKADFVEYGFHHPYHPDQYHHPIIIHAKYLLSDHLALQAGHRGHGAVLLHGLPGLQGLPGLRQALPIPLLQPQLAALFWSVHFSSVQFSWVQFSQTH